MLEMRDVTFHYTDGTPVLEHMNLTIGAGEFIGLGGRNGCGKTTVTRLLMGLEIGRYFPGWEENKRRRSGRTQSLYWICIPAAGTADVPTDCAAGSSLWTETAGPQP